MKLIELENVLNYIRVNHYYCDAENLAVSFRNGFDDVIIRVTDMKTYRSQEFNYKEILKEFQKNT